MIEGVKLMFVGMTTVLLFLSFMIFLIQMVSRLTRGLLEKEMEAIELERQLRLLAQKKKDRKQLDDHDEIVVITAAIAAYEAEKTAA